MPSIAQQDYLRPSGKSLNDCHLSAALAHNIAQKTIFDTIIGVEDSGDEYYAKPISVFTSGSSITSTVYIYDAVGGKIQEVFVEYTQTQYEGLAAIQDATDNYNEIPTLTTSGDADNYLTEQESGDVIMVGGKILIPTINENGYITEITISQIDGDGFDITWEDAQKLIGLPLV